MQAKRIHSSSRNARDLNRGTGSQKGNPQAGHECAQCGAIIPPGEAKCPYCGSYYEPEAEREYMRNLDQMRSDLDKVGNIGEETSRTEARRIRKRVIRILAGILIFSAATIPFLISMNRHDGDPSG